MSLTSKSACGCSCPANVQYASSHGQEVVLWQCGSALVLLDVKSGQQRLLVGNGIRSFACCAKANIIAVVEQGYQPRVSVYNTADLQLLQSIEAGAAFGYTAVALSADGQLLAVCGAEPDFTVSIWLWRKGLKLASAELKAPVDSISFHPADISCLLTLATAPPPAAAQTAASRCSASTGCDTAGRIDGSQTVQLWQLDKLWDRHELSAVPVQLPAGCAASCHTWAPEGVYLGCTDGTVLCINPETAELLSTSPPAAAAAVTATPLVVDAAAEAPTTATAVLQTAEAATTGAGISSIAVNRHWVAAASKGLPELTFYGRCPAAADAVTSAQQPHKQQQLQTTVLQLLGRVKVSLIGCESVCFGGALHRDLLVSTSDGSLLLLSQQKNSSTADPPDPASLQVEPLADWHVGAVTGVAAAPGGSHMISCGTDGSIRVWAAAAGGQLVSKRDVGGRITCCAAFVGAAAGTAHSSHDRAGSSCVGPGAGRPLLAVGSESGVLRLISLADMQNLPVVYRSRLFSGPISQLHFSPEGSHLAVAAAKSTAVALFRFTMAGQVEVLGYVTAPDNIVSMCWLHSSASSKHAQLLLSLQSGKLMIMTPPAQAAKSTRGSTTSASGSKNGPEHLAALSLSTAEVQGATFSVDVPLQALAVFPPLPSSPQTRSVSSSSGAVHGPAQIVGLGSDRQLHWLQLPQDAVGWAALKSGSKKLQSIANVSLPAASTGLTPSPSGQQLLVTAQDGSLLLLPATAAAASAALASSGDAGIAAVPAGSAAAAASMRVAWSAGGHWVASAAADGGLMLHAVHPGAGGSTNSPPALPVPAGEAVDDQEGADDDSGPTLPEAAAAAAASATYAAADSVRQSTLQRLQDLKSRLEKVVEANAVAPPEQRISDAELILDIRLLAEQRAQLSSEEAQLLSGATHSSHVQEVQAKRLKALCWDAFQVKRAVCTGLKSGEAQAENFQLPVQSDDSWAQVAKRRRDQILEVYKQLVADQDMFTRSAASSIAVGASAPLSSSDGGVAVPSTSFEGSTSGADTTTMPGGNAAAASRSSITTGGPSDELSALVARLQGCADAKDCKAPDLMVPELEVVTPEAKLLQAEVYKRRVWELKTQFNNDFDGLVKQKHAEADRLTDLNLRMDELIRELVKIHLVLNPTAATEPPSPTPAAAEAAGKASLSKGLSVRRPGSAAAGDAAGGRPGAGVLSATQLSDELAVGRLVAHWSPEEDQEEVVLSIKQDEIKATKYLTPAEREKATAGAAAAEAARRAAAADISRDRALQQMMGGRLDRSVDEVSDLLASRPAWMVTGDPSDFAEEQLREYKEYQAKEAAAIEERLKRKGIMETELRTLKSAAEDIGAKFDMAVAALAARRLDVLAEVNAFECRVLRLLADEEVASVTAGSEVQQTAATKLQATRQALAAVEQELSEKQQLHDQLQEALSALHADERSVDRSFKREFAMVDATIMPRLTAMFKARLVPRSKSPNRSEISATGGTGSIAAEGSAAHSAAKAQGLRVAPSFRASRVGHASGAQHQTDSAQVLSPGYSFKPGAVSADGAAAASAELEFLPWRHGPNRIGSAAASAAALAGAAGAGAAAAAAAAGHGHSAGPAGPAANQQDLLGPLGPVEMVILEVPDSARPDGLDEMLWQRFVELRTARASLEITVRQQTAELFCMKRHLQLLQQHQSKLSIQAQAEVGTLSALRARQTEALQDVELQLSLKQGQVECWPKGLTAIPPDALLVTRPEVKGLNSIILSKGDAKLELLRKMKEFKRGIYQLEWENQKCDMEAEDVTSLTQQLQLLHVTKEFQQQVKTGSSASHKGAARTGKVGASATPAAPTAPAAAPGGAAGGGAGASAADKEVASLENLLKVRETLHASAIEKRRRQLKSIEAKQAAKAHENATLALHLTGLERMLDEAARLRAAVAAEDASAASDRLARSLMMQSKLRDIAEAQAAEISVAQAELNEWQQRCFPCLPSLPGDDDNQQPGGQDQASSSHFPCHLSNVTTAGHGVSKGVRVGTDAVSRAGVLEVLAGSGGFLPYGARAVAAAAARGGSFASGVVGAKGTKALVGPDGKLPAIKH